MVCMRLSTRVFGWRLVTGDVIALCHLDDFMFAKDTVIIGNSLFLWNMVKEA